MAKLVLMPGLRKQEIDMETLYHEDIDKFACALGVTVEQAIKVATDFGDKYPNIISWLNGRRVMN